MRVGDTISYTYDSGTVGTCTATFFPQSYMESCPTVQVEAEVDGLTCSAVVPQGAVGYKTAVLFSSGAGNAYTEGDGVAVLRPAGQRGAIFIHDGQVWDTAANGLFCTDRSVESPEVRENMAEALARDGFIDKTEQFGKPVFGNRTLTWRFLVTEEDWESIYASVRDFIADMHGRKVGILVDDYEGWIFTGRLGCSIPQQRVDGTYIEVTANCDPFRKDGFSEAISIEAEELDVGPGSYVAVEGGVAKYLNDPSSYSLHVNAASAPSNARWRVMASYGNLAANGNDDWWSTMLIGSSWNLEVDFVAGQEGYFEDYIGVFIPDGGADLYVLMSVSDLNSSAKLSGFQSIRARYGSGSWATVNGHYGQPVLVATLSGTSYQNAFLRLEYKAKSTSRAGLKGACYIVAVPHGEQFPSFQEYDGTGPDFTNICLWYIAQGTGIPSSPMEVASKNRLWSSMGEPRAIIANAIGTTVTARLSTQAATAVLDLSNLGHRFYHMEASIPASSSSDPPYVEVDGTRYYADTDAYRVGLNVAEDSSVIVYRTGPSVTVEGLAI